ncbi:phosphomannomutase [Methylophaga sulfidovorans]|uniref:Phosphomannomutase n=1 Tax=Methylophaga sulfidovorans TaxID=45496 RepID=A0A1I3XNH1_9GAMM|nr:phosphomannomutase [Methylophaga sulfidovorans]SFK21167.1 phosphomannomutase [Methylophaga sulfidovorans]
MKIHIEQLMSDSGVKFGTSGTRGLVTDMTDRVCFAYTAAFLQHLIAGKQIQKGDRVGIGGDLRQSTPRIMNAVATACQHYGLQPVNLGFIPSPAVALYGIQYKMASIMVTGSHIPDDRNGMKFNLPIGEILQADEQAIKQQFVDLPDELFNNDGQFVKQDNILAKPSLLAETLYIERFSEFFPENCLSGMTIGIYQHSAVARDLLQQILSSLGANTICLGRSEQFVSVDTEAIRPEDVKLAQQWAAENKLDAIVSTDGDSDRPLLSDENGRWLRGDIVGLLTAIYLAADIVVTPVSSNSSVNADFFEQVIRTRIGSPYVISAMQNAASDSEKSVVGYEANGGFLQQSVIALAGNTLSPLPTRDAVIVILSVLLLAKQRQQTVSELNSSMPAIYTSSDRLKNFALEKSRLLLEILLPDNHLNRELVKQLFPFMDEVNAVDTTDGIRMSFADDEIIHIRPSGNAPELRCYTEASDEHRAVTLNQQVLDAIQCWANSA